ncbi:MAG TPA: SurA N-terminal domain-containing protein, partial [Solirubrobacterales bacterium]|nr:SurA N-terminal domain-containing protein [Solirubrobacterales bacterium]
MNRGFLSKRNLAIIFGAALVLTVVIVGVAVGVGHRSVPSNDVAVIDDDSIDIPGLAQDGVISKANFNRFLAQTARQSGLQSVPQPSDPQYKQLKDQAMQTALQIAWIVGEAHKEGLSFTDTQIQQSLQQIKSQFKTQAEYVKARDQAGLTDADVLQRAKLQLIQNTIQDNLNKNVA